MTAKLLRYNFDWYGYRSIKAANGLEGLEQARNSKSLDLIISDAEMPVSDDFEFLQSVPTFPPPKPPILNHSEFIAEHSRIVGLNQAGNAKKTGMKERR